jgi:hypothetical protein
MRSTINALVGGIPVTVTPKAKQAILIWQEQGAAHSSRCGNGRWILHLMQDGDYVVDLRADYAAPRRITGQYPATGWSASLEPTSNGVRIKTGGNAKDRLLVLQ